MPTPVNSQLVDERLEQLYRRHLLVGEDSVANYYESGRGYYKPELAAQERERFSISLVRTNGEVHKTGDHARPFALQSISKVFVYGLALADHGGDYVLEHVGVTHTGVFPCSPQHSLQDQVVGCVRLIRSSELKLIRSRAGTKHELAAGENTAPTQHPRLLRGRKGMNAIVRYGDDRALVLNERAVLDHHALVRDADKTSAATFHIEDGIDRLLRQQPLLYLL